MVYPLMKLEEVTINYSMKNIHLLRELFSRTDFPIHFIFKFKQYKNTNIANFVYDGKFDWRQQPCDG